MPRCLALLAGLVVLAACGSDKGPGAAEPATAPPASESPAGNVRDVAVGPEGIVYDPNTDTLAVAVREPARLLLLDPDTLETRTSVALPGTVRHLQLAKPGGPVLVPDESSGRLIEVSLPDGATRTTQVEKQPHDAAGVDGDVIVVGNEFGKSISFVRDGKVLDIVSGPEQPGGIVGAGDTVAVIDVGKFTISTYDVSTHEQLASTNAGGGPTHGVLLPNGRVLVADTRDNALLLYQLDPLRKLGQFFVSGTPYGMVVDNSTVWVTLTARNQVVGLDYSRTQPRMIAEYPTARQPNTVAVDPGSHRIWVTGTDDGTIQLITR